MIESTDEIPSGCLSRVLCAVATAADYPIANSHHFIDRFNGRWQQITCCAVQTLHSRRNNWIRRKNRFSNGIGAHRSSAQWIVLRFVIDGQTTKRTHAVKMMTNRVRMMIESHRSVCARARCRCVDYSRNLQCNCVNSDTEGNNANDIFSSSSSSLDSMCLINECTSLYNCYGGRLFSTHFGRQLFAALAAHRNYKWLSTCAVRTGVSHSFNRSIGWSVCRPIATCPQRGLKTAQHMAHGTICTQHLTNTLTHTYTLNRLRTSSDENGYCQAPAASTWAQLGRH